MDCNVFRRQIVHFQADELPAADRAEMQGHLEACAPCAARLELEASFLRALQARLRPGPVPPGLETRIRAGLSEERSPHAGAWGWLRAPWFAATAASLLLVALLVPGRPDLKRADTPVVRVSQEVLVVDRDCDRAGAPIAAQRACRNQYHLNALKLPDGSYWNVSLDRESSRSLLVDAEMRGHRMHVEGEFFPRIRTLRLDGTEDLGLITVQAAHHRVPR